MTELVSILIPCYNAERWVGETIESALSQTWPNTEIIIVDDGSTDNSLQIAKHYESATVKVISQENKGAAAARNTALEYAQGDYIQWLDADDLLAPEKIEWQMRKATSLGNSKLLFSSSWAEFYYQYQKAKFVPNSLWCDLAPVDWLITKFKENVYMTNTSWLVSRTLTEMAGPWDVRLTLDDDGEYSARLVASSEKIIFVPKARSYYRRSSPKSLSSGYSDRSGESQFLSKTLCIGHLRALEDSERTRKACLMFLQSYSSYYYLKQQASILAKEIGGELSPPIANWRLSIARAVLGRKLAAKMRRRLAWELKILIRANLDKLLYNLSKK